MKIWLSKNSEVPLKEQLVAQITLGILSGDLPPGDKLSSTAEIARRFKVHSNTVSSAYRELVESGWVEFREGSGFYVIERAGRSFDQDGVLNKLVADFIRDAGALEFSAEEIRAAVEIQLNTLPARDIVLVESDKALREIILNELCVLTDCEIRGMSFEEFEETYDGHATVVAMIDERPKIEPLLGGRSNSVFLKARSVAEALSGQTRPDEDNLIAVISGWNSFLNIAKTLLVAAQINADSLLLRSTTEKNWRAGLETVSMIICDCVAAKKLPDNKKLRIFRIVSSESINELQKLIAGN